MLDIIRFCLTVIAVLISLLFALDSALSIRYPKFKNYKPWKYLILQLINCTILLSFVVYIYF
jgi:hypothetical protein